MSVNVITHDRALLPCSPPVSRIVRSLTRRRIRIPGVDTFWIESRLPGVFAPDRPREHSYCCLSWVIFPGLFVRAPFAPNLVGPVPVALPSIQSRIQRSSSFFWCLHSSQPTTIRFPTADVLAVRSNEAFLATIGHGLSVRPPVTVREPFVHLSCKWIMFMIAHSILPAL